MFSQNTCFPYERQCLKPFHTCNGTDITTVEGLGDRRRGYHPLQLRLDDCSGTQCGYCTPGMVMNMHGLMASGAPLNMVNIERSFAGNMCRCTGYRSILDAFKSFAVDAPAKLIDQSRVSETVCSSHIIIYIIFNFQNGNHDELVDIEDLSGYCPYRVANYVPPKNVVVADQGKVWQRVTTLPELLAALQAAPDDRYMLVVGNTSHGLTRTPPDITNFIDIYPIEELHAVQHTADKLTVGSLVTLSEMVTVMSAAATEAGFDYLQDLAEHYHQIANVPVRNVRT